MKTNKFEVGQELFQVFINNRSKHEPRYIKITKIGRKWVYVGEDWRETRFDPKTMIEDAKGYSPNSRFYFSEADYREEKLKREIWSEFLKEYRFGKNPPKNLSAKRLREIVSEFDGGNDV